MLLRRPVSRYELDTLAGVANAPDLVAQLRRRGLDLPCERIGFVDRDGEQCRPGVYTLTEAAASIKPPGTLKKPESIAAWWASESPAAAQEAWRKQSLDSGTKGEIVSIAVCNGEGREWVHCRAQGENEAALLVAFIEAVEGWTADDAAKVQGCASAWPLDDHYLVAHNAAFDLGFLWRRMAVHGVRIPKWLPSPSARAGRDYGDTMALWAGYGGRISLDALCGALDVPSPKDGGIDGSKVFDAWLAGQHEAIAAYNLRDAQAVASVWHRLAAVGAV